jgi:hypothetical protein
MREIDASELVLRPGPPLDAPTLKPTATRNSASG